MVAHIVVGVGYGDEGKGRIVYELAKELRDVATMRTGGGPNCGHTVRYGDKTHICSSIPANFLRSQPGFLGPKVLVSPEMFLEEHKQIEIKFYISPEITIDDECPIITPFDVYVNQQDSLTLGATTGKGIHNTQKRTDAGVSFKFRDLCGPDFHLLQKLEAVKQYYKITDDFTKHIQLFLQASKWLRDKNRCGTPTYYDNVIFEGNQGFYLDEEFGYFPNVTHASTTAKNALSILKKWKVKGQSINRINLHFVTRAYQTRHGAGPFSKEKLELMPLLNETNVSNEFQGDFRVAPIDINMCNFAIETNRKLVQSTFGNVDFNNYIHVTCTSDLKEFDANLYTPLKRLGQVQFHD